MCKKFIIYRIESVPQPLYERGMQKYQWVLMLSYLTLRWIVIWTRNLESPRSISCFTVLSPCPSRCTAGVCRNISGYLIIPSSLPLSRVITWTRQSQHAHRAPTVCYVWSNLYYTVLNPYPSRHKTGAYRNISQYSFLALYYWAG